LTHESGDALFLKLQARQQDLRPNRCARRLGEIRSDAPQLGDHVVERCGALPELTVRQRAERDRDERDRENEMWPEHSLHLAFWRMKLLSQGSTLRGVGRLHRGHRNLGCVGYNVQHSGSGSVVRFDPMPDAAQGDVFHLTIEDGRILECEVVDECTTACVVLDGPRVERRHHRRPAPTARIFL
jgi:hypothetical protein